MWRNCLVVAAGLGLLTGTATAQIYNLARGNVTVDGVIQSGEWDHANWMDLDQVYHGDPVDLSNASWAALWNEAENVLYIAVVGTDTSHVMHAHNGWDGQDGIELYVNVRNDDITDYASRLFDYAQQYAIGWDPAADSLFVVLGGDTVMPPAGRPEMAFGMVGNELTYEVKVRPYNVFDHGNVAASTEITLAADLVIGLDLVMNSRTVTDQFGMLCENVMVSKFNDAGQLRDHRLTDAGPRPVGADMAAGSVVVDGIISTGEWDDAYWTAMTNIYHGNPTDVSNAAWAAFWDDKENAIYVAVTATDTSHVMQAHAGWDAQDGIELYINARNDDIAGYASRGYDFAQRYAAGWDAAATSLWVVMGGGDVLPSNALPAAAFGMVTNDLTYEFKLRPFNVFDYSNVVASTEIPLTTGMVVGVDVLLNSRTVGGDFGVLCENAMPQKDFYAGNFLDHRLLPPPPPPGMVLIIKGKRPW